MYFLIGFCLFVSITLIAVYIMEHKQQMSLRLSAYFDPGSVDIAPGDSVWEKIKKFALPKIGPLLPGIGITDYNNKIIYAGLAGKMRGEEIYLLKITAGLLPPLLIPVFVLLGSGTTTILLLVGITLIGYIFPDLWLKTKITEKQEAIDKELFGFLDVLIVCTEAGLNLTDSIKRTIRYQEGVLADEFRQAIWEIETGKGITESLTSMAHRNLSEDLEKIIHTINQSIKRGTSISTMLKGQAKHMRELRRTKAQELAQKANLKILMPVVFCILFPLLLIIAGPAFITLLDLM